MLQERNSFEEIEFFEILNSCDLSEIAQKNAKDGRERLTRERFLKTSAR